MIIAVIQRQLLDLEKFTAWEGVMASIQDYIEEVVREQISQGQAVDVYRVARDILRDYPDQQLKQVADLVSIAVIKRHGNAFWQKDEAEPPDSESERRIA